MMNALFGKMKIKFAIQNYEAEPFFNVTVEEVEEWKANNIRGYIKREEI